MPSTSKVCPYKYSVLVEVAKSINNNNEKEKEEKKRKEMLSFIRKGNQFYVFFSLIDNLALGPFYTTLIKKQLNGPN